MYPRHSVIKHIQDPDLRARLYAAGGIEGTALAIEYPACFATDRSDLCFPGSLVLRRAYDALKTWPDSKPLDHDALLAQATCLWRPRCGLPIPINFYWDDATGPAVPPEIQDQILGRSLSPWMTVDYMEYQFLVGKLWPVPYSHSDPEIGLGRPIAPGKYEIHLVDPRFIDLTA